MEDYFNEYLPAALFPMKDKNYEYNRQFNECLEKATHAVNNKKNVIVCGPGRSGKTYMSIQLKDLLNNYDIYYGIQDYHYRNKSNGRHYNTNKFWIEETNEDLVSNVIEEYEYIPTTLQYNP